eukprot:31031-Pelagococcus_subviridis.AAC.9
MSDEVVSETHNVSDAARKTEETLRFYENFERDFEKNFSQADATDTDYSGSGSGSDENENENEDEDAWAERWEREQWAARVATPRRRFSLADGSSDAAAATFGPGGLSLGERTTTETTIVSLDAFAALLDAPTEDRLGDVDDEGKCRGLSFRRRASSPVFPSVSTFERDAVRLTDRPSASSPQGRARYASDEAAARRTLQKKTTGASSRLRVEEGGSSGAALERDRVAAAPRARARDRRRPRDSGRKRGALD